jgi:hypothetical protein
MPVTPFVSSPNCSPPYINTTAARNFAFILPRPTYPASTQRPLTTRSTLRTLRGAPASSLESTPPSPATFPDPLRGLHIHRQLNVRSLPDQLLVRHKAPRPEITSHTKISRTSLIPGINTKEHYYRLSRLPF